jgi:hypothetical protein
MTSDAVPGGEGRPAYLIVLRHVLVAQDIAMTIADRDPGASVVTVASPSEALPALAGVDRLSVAFVAEAPRVLRGSDLAQAIAARGGRVVLIGEAAEAEGTALGFPVLTRPFSTEDILEHLAAGPG